MSAISNSYARLAKETGRPCYSVTFWRTIDGRWGARAGLGTEEFGDTIEAAIEAAVTNAIAAQAARSAAIMNEARCRMTALEFSIRLPGGGDPLSDRNLDALHAAGCGYATFSTHGDGLLVACLDTDGDPEPAACAAFADIARALPGAEIVTMTVIGRDTP